jgi:glycosyltransferase involved in cell wall biosynthesis
VVFEAHEIFHKTTERPGKAAALKAMEAYVYREADAVIAITAALAAEIAELFGRKAEKVIPDGVGSEFLKVRRRGKGSVLLYTGQFYPWKGVEVFVRSLSDLPDERAVVVGGSGEALERLKRLAEELGVAGRVEFPGTVPHAGIREYLEEARVAVLPNLAGGVSRFTSPLKLFEYMAAGVPIVASDLPALREVLRDRENAVLVPPGDPEALAAGIRSLLADEALAARIAARAREEAAEYTWDRRAGKIREVLENLRR